MKSYNIAILGATGAVSRELLELLENRQFPVADLKVLALSNSACRTLQFRGEELLVESVDKCSFENVDLVFASADSSTSKAWAPIAVAAGAVVIDNSSAFRMNPQVPLVVPEINPEAVAGHQGIIANPNCTTILMSVAVWPLHKVKPVQRIIAATYQSVSGIRAMEEMKEQARSILAGKPPKAEIFPYPLAFNLFPHNSSLNALGYCEEEMKMVNETPKIFGAPTLRVSATCVRVPVLRADSEALNIEFGQPFSVAEAREILRQAPGVKLVEDWQANYFPMPMEASGRDEVFVGRIRQDISHLCGLELWLSGDQIRKGAALNAVQIAELLVAKDLLRSSVAASDNPQHNNCQLFEYAILGAGASAVYYLQNAKNASTNKDKDEWKPVEENTAIIGELQPWAKERGSEGVINHPIEMIVSEHPRIKDDGDLATRKVFSNYIQDELDRWPHKYETRIEKVIFDKEKNYYKIYTLTTEGKKQTFKARKVVVALGIGKHKEPPIEWDGEKDNDTNMVVKEKKIPKVMDMDQFQRATEEGTLDINSLNSIAVVGPNAPIDVMTTLLRQRAQQTTPQIYWITGLNKKPYFLPGTDNEYVEKIYNELQPKDNNNLILSGHGISVYKYNCLNIKVTSNKVEVEVGKEKKQGKKEEGKEVVEPLKPETEIVVEPLKIETEVVVYGIGPDVSALLSILDPTILCNLEADYDKDMHFNNDSEEIDEQGIKIAIKEFIKKSITEEEATERAKKIISLLASTGDLKVERKEDKLPRLLPSVIRLISKKHKSEKPTMIIIGGAAYRIAIEKQVRYQYVSHMLKRLKDEELDDLEKYDDKNLSAFVTELASYIDYALKLAQIVEESESDKKKEDTTKYCHQIDEVALLNLWL